MSGTSSLLLPSLHYEEEDDEEDGEENEEEDEEEEEGEKECVLSDKVKIQGCQILITDTLKASSNLCLLLLGWKSNSNRQ